jgi:hypothetical protein
MITSSFLSFYHFHKNVQAGALLDFILVMNPAGQHNAVTLKQSSEANQII